MSNTQSSVDESSDGSSRLGKFIQTYHSFLSSFVIGGAGLIATSSWQYRQSEIAQRQAESQQQIARTQAENSWRIERAEILSKNLQVLATSGENTMEQRYGVLLSLTRGNLLDPELAVSYALELGKDNAEYMQSVLANTAGKDYARLATAFEPTCEQRYGVSRDVPVCKTDLRANRSEAIAELFSDEVEAARKKHELGPSVLLQDERDVQSSPARLAWLFSPYLRSLYDRRQWKEIEAFEGQSTGARLVSALVLGPARKHELVATSEVREVDQFHDARAGWLVEYLLRPSCDAECKGKLTDNMLTSHSNALGRYDKALRTVLGRPRDEVANVFGRMQARLLACQLPEDDVDELRDHILVPALSDELSKQTPENARVEELLDLLALVPEPTQAEAADESAETQAFRSALTRARAVMGDKFKQSYARRRSYADGLRQNPPAHAKKSMFCSAGKLLAVPSEFDE